MDLTIYNFAAALRNGTIGVQGDTSGRTKPPVDIKTKVVFQYKEHILKRNICFDGLAVV